MRKFVVLAPDPIVFAPWSVLLDCTARLVRTRSRHISLASFAVLFVIQYEEQGRQLSHNHCDCTTCSNHVFGLLVSILVTRRPRRVPSTMSTHGKPLCPSVKTLFTKPPSQDRQLRTGKSDVYQQPIAGLTLLAWECGLLLSMRCSVPFCSMPYHKSIVGRPWR